MLSTQIDGAALANASLHGYVTLAQAGWTDVCELARSDDDGAVLLRAQCAPPSPSDQKIV